MGFGPRRPRAGVHPRPDVVAGWSTASVGTAVGRRLGAELEALPLAEHHADRALQRMLGDGMRRFRPGAGRRRPTPTRPWNPPSTPGLPVEWAVLPMVLTGWDAAYYGPGRRAGAWAMDLPTALSLGLDIRRGWDERHVPEQDGTGRLSADCASRNQHPDSPVRQVLSLVRGGNPPESAVEADALDADLLGWLHLLRVMIQVDRNFSRDRLHALWALRERDWVPYPCTRLRCRCFSHHHHGLGPAGPAQENPGSPRTPLAVTDSAPLVRVRQQAERPRFGLDMVWRPTSRARRNRVWEYTVRPGDVLGTIARRTGLRIEDIRRWNRIDGDLIRVGQTLILRGGLPPGTCALRPPLR